MGLCNPGECPVRDSRKAAPAQSAPCLAATAKRTQRHPQDGTESKLIYKKKKEKEKNKEGKKILQKTLNRRKVWRCRGRRRWDRRSKAPGGRGQALVRPGIVSASK